MFNILSRAMKCIGLMVKKISRECYWHSRVQVKGKARPTKNASETKELDKPCNLIRT